MAIVKEVTNVEIEFAENGFVVNYSGRNEEDDWKGTKKIFASFDDLTAHLQEVYYELSEYKNG